MAFALGAVAFGWSQDAGDAMPRASAGGGDASEAHDSGPSRAAGGDFAPAVVHTPRSSFASDFRALEMNHDAAVLARVLHPRRTGPNVTGPPAASLLAAGLIGLSAVARARARRAAR